MSFALCSWNFPPSWFLDVAQITCPRFLVRSLRVTSCRHPQAATGLIHYYEFQGIDSEAAICFDPQCRQISTSDPEVGDLIVLTPSPQSIISLGLCPLPWQLLSLCLTSQYSSALLLSQRHGFTTCSEGNARQTGFIHGNYWSLMFREMVAHWMLHIRAVTLLIRDNKRCCRLKCPSDWAQGLSRQCQRM